MDFKYWSGWFSGLLLPAAQKSQTQMMELINPSFKKPFKNKIKEAAPAWNCWFVIRSRYLEKWMRTDNTRNWDIGGISHSFSSSIFLIFKEKHKYGYKFILLGYCSYDNYLTNKTEKKTLLPLMQLPKTLTVVLEWAELNIWICLFNLI